ncbi:hypothetical protein CRUP_005753 [Coryphaenoides rupestris]|nr:hypothetical protein CRUP_005753 [Coryphaenoides rupestris]
MRRVEPPPPQAFQAPVDVHASADGQVYMFRRERTEPPSNSSSSSQEDDAESEDFRLLELRPQLHPEQDGTERVQLLERELLEGDTLNKLALQYGCKVADIKRANSLFQEQDLFALKSIKIPVQKHSFLTEAFTDPTDPLRATSTLSSSSSSSSPAHHGMRNTRAQPSLREVSDFLKDVDHDIEKLIQSTNSRDDIFPDSASNLLSARSGVRGRGRAAAAGYGADWGIQWWNVVVALLLIGVVIPIFYVVYFKTKASGDAAVLPRWTVSAARQMCLPASGALGSLGPSRRTGSAAVVVVVARSTQRFTSTSAEFQKPPQICLQAAQLRATSQPAGSSRLLSVSPSPVLPLPAGVPPGRQQGSLCPRSGSGRSAGQGVARGNGRSNLLSVGCEYEYCYTPVALHCDPARLCGPAGCLCSKGGGGEMAFLFVGDGVSVGVSVGLSTKGRFRRSVSSGGGEAFHHRL